MAIGGQISRRQFQDLEVFSMPAGFRGRPAWFVQFWWIVQDTLFKWSPQAMFGWRRLLLLVFGAKIGSDVRIRSSARITYPWKLSIGAHVWIGEDCVLYNLAEIEIGSHVALAHGVYLCTGLHDCEQVNFPIQAQTIRIEDEVWLTNDVFVAPGVTVGRGAVVGARSSVFKSLPTGMICFGSPAVPVRERIPRPATDAVDPTCAFSEGI